MKKLKDLERIYKLKIFGLIFGILFWYNLSGLILGKIFDRIIIDPAVGFMMGLVSSILWIVVKFGQREEE